MSVTCNMHVLMLQRSAGLSCMQPTIVHAASKRRAELTQCHAKVTQTQAKQQRPAGAHRMLVELTGTVDTGKRGASSARARGVRTSGTLNTAWPLVVSAVPGGALRPARASDGAAGSASAEEEEAGARGVEGGSGRVTIAETVPRFALLLFLSPGGAAGKGEVGGAIVSRAKGGC